MPATLPIPAALQAGFFSGGASNATLDQAWFDTAFAAYKNGNKIYKDAFMCDIIDDCNMSMFMETFSDYDTTSYSAYTLLEKLGRRKQIKVGADVTIPTSATTGVITLSATDKFVSSTYILPIVGNTIVLPNGALCTVTAVTGTTSITVRQRGAGAAYALVTGNELLVLPGAEISDCAAPAGQFRFDVVPNEHDLTMIEFGDRGELCGKLLHEAQWLKIPFYNDKNEQTDQLVYTQAQKDMYQGLEYRKHYESLLNPSFGIIPVLKARGLNFVPASNSAITVTDVREWKALINQAGISCTEYAIFAGREKFSQWQQMLGTTGVTNLLYAERPMNDCAWINLEYCGIKVEGMTLHIYEEKTFSNGMQLGGAGSVFPNSMVWFPMVNNTNGIERSVVDLNRGVTYNNKLFKRVYYKSAGNGKVWDMMTDENGVISAARGGRNSFAAGLEKQEWTVKTKFLNEIHCARAWGWTGF